MKSNFLHSVLKLALVTFSSIFAFVALYFVLMKTGIIGRFSNVTELKRIISSAGFFSYFVFAVLQFLQVTFVPLPSSITTIVGVVMFGAVKAFFISLLAILLGSFVAYMLGRTLGTKVLCWAVGEQNTAGVQKLLGKGKMAFFLMMLLPFFPDDVLCLVAGVSHMNFKFFVATNLITRTIGLFCRCFLGNISVAHILI